MMVSSVFSQNKIKHFSSDSSLFFQEMEEFLTYSRKQDGAAVMDEFSWDWFGGKFSDKQREGVYKVTNLMLKKRKKPFPDFKNYLFTVSQFVNSKYQTEQSFESWQDILVKLIKGKSKKRFTDYLKSCNSLFSENLLYKSSANSWAANNSNYTFGYDSLPTIKFEALTLTCYSKGDSSVIKNTKGIYYPTEAKWVGEGGKITWERAGFSPDSVYAEINHYSFSLKSPKYIIKNVIFYDYLYFDKPLEGVLEEKVLANVKTLKATYPRFNSYEALFEIKNISEGVDYIGGFSLYGRKVIGRGTKDQDAYLIFKRNNIPFLKMASKTFVIKPERIVSQIASATFYIKEDSIYHPGLAFKFFIDERSVSLIRDNKGIKITPYFNSYHQVDMNFESLTWKVDSPMIEFRNMKGGTKTDATFVSSNYYSQNSYMKMMTLQTKHPLYTIKKLVDKMDTTYLTNQDMAEFTLQSYNQIETMLLNLSNMGFINYNYEGEYFIVKDKLLNWVKASGGNVDYDVIGFYSNIKGYNNATLSLLNYDLKIRGVSSINVSDSQEVIIYPSRKEITLKKNRDFDFSGVVQAGRFDIMGSNFSFKYDEFKIDMPNVDSLRIYAETGAVDKHGDLIIRPVKTVIEKISGDLLIDRPDNKSGVKRADEYPILNSYRDSYVFYDKKSIQGGVYNKDDFYFHVEPFTIDSLDNFDNSQLKFKGTMLSAGIFPDFDETLTLQSDHSLGFIRETPTGGYPMYGGKGTFHDTIRLSNQGLRGNGKLEYITSTTFSNDFIFFPDSMNAIAQNFNVKESPVEIEFPPVEGENIMTRWYPNRDIMIHRERDKPIAMYDMKSYMHGQTMITPEGLQGNGTFEFQKAELEANLIKFKFKDFQSDTADFRLKSEGDKDALDFSTVNVNAYVTFDGRYGQFKSNGGGSYISFDPMQYICFMEEFKWYMDNEDIELTAGNNQATDASGVKLDGAQFISVNPDQDSLSFFSSRAKYDYRKKIIYADGVKFINVADVMIYPDSGKIVVEKKAKMRTLNNSKIIASYITQNHIIYNSTTNVFGKKDYAASGYIDYVDEIEKIQTIYFQNIAVDSSGQTYATAELKDTANFTLSPNYEFYGKVKLFANNEYLTFKGFSRIFHDCDLLSRNWFSFEQEINPYEIYIPIDSTTKDINGNPLIASIFLSPDSLGIYTSYVNNKKKYSHIPVLAAEGFLYYDKEKEEYKISNKDKLQEMSFTGNYLSLNTKNCKVHGEGNIELGNETGQVEIQAAGIIEHNQLDDEVIFDMVMITDFFFNDDALKKLTKKLQEESSLDPAKLDRPTFEKGLRELIGSAEGDKLIAQANLNGEFKKVPKSLDKTMVFNDIKMRWNDNSKSFKSFGKLGLSNIKNKQINKYVEGKVELVKKRSGDIFTIYIEIDRNNWYFFTYTRGIMQAISSNVDFNSAITETKPDKRKSKAEKGQESYQYMYSTERKKRDFLRKFDD
ncbi:MAG: hypothetical protein COA97_12700 [Flavobacteriales bacterium]|nr:MAG: hypothetical protein COA97_12700 [Flavobacteriales bacterium]